MNTLFFAAAGFAFLFSLKAEKGEGLREILAQTFQIFLSAAFIVTAAALMEHKAFFPKEEFEFTLIPFVFLIYRLSGQPLIFFLSICGLSFPLLEPAAPAEHALKILQTAGLFAGFRFLMLSFRERALFSRTPAPFFGMPLLLAQAFWASLVLVAWASCRGLTP